MRFIFLAPFLLAAAAAAAQDAPPAAGTATPAALVPQLGASGELRRVYHGFTAQERAEFNRVFELYERHVALRLSQGWVYHDDPKVNGSIARLRIPDDVVALSLWDIQHAELPRDKQILGGLMERHNDPARRNDASDRQAGALAARIEDVQRDERRVWGRCGDWADEIKARLLAQSWSSLAVGHTEMITANAVVHAVAGAAAEHASVRVCGKTSGLCAVLDPWRTGKAAVQGPEEWRRGGRLKMCLDSDPGNAHYCR